VRRFALLSLSLILLTSCRPHGEASVAGLPAALDAAAAGSPGEIRRMGRRGGDGAWYALAAAAEDAGLEAVARNLRLRSYRRDSDPYALRALTDLLLEDPEAVGRPLRALRRAEGDDERRREARIAVLASRGRVRALVREMEDFRGAGYEAPVLSAALRTEGATLRNLAALDRYVLHCPEPAALEFIPDEFASTLMNARRAFAAGDDSAALEGYAAWLEAAVSGGDVCDWEGIPPVFGEMAAAAGRRDRSDDWARRLFDAAAQLEGAKRYGAAYHAGRLYRDAGDRRAAAAAFLAAAGALDSGLERDRALWYRLKVMGEGGGFSAAEEAEALAWTSGSWNEPRRFADVLEEAVHRMVVREDWDGLASLHRDWGAVWPPAARARAALILAFAVGEGRLEGPRSADAYLREAAGAESLEWPVLRAAGLTERSLSIPEESEPSSVAGREDAFVRLYLRWGLVERAAQAVLSRPRDYSDAAIREVARALAPADPRRSIRIIGTLAFRDGYRPGREDLLIRHPLPMGDRAAQIARSQGLPPHLFHGLIRVESAWDAEAVSRTGAQGLAQFMPATWEEWVRRTGAPSDADPRDPELNLTLAAAYLEWLWLREWTAGWTDVLVSYNAGGGRLRSWRRQRPGFGDELFAMSLAVAEPRHYVDRVLSAATLYGYLYSGRSPGDLHRSWGLPDP